MDRVEARKRTMAQFFSAVEPLHSAYQDSHLSYAAIREHPEFAIAKARLRLAVRPQVGLPKSFRSEKVIAGWYPLTKLGRSAKQLLDEITSGEVDLPEGRARFLHKPKGDFEAQFTPFHEEGFSCAEPSKCLGSRRR